MALVGMTRALGAELADDKITANIVVPGLIDTVRGAAPARSPMAATRTCWSATAHRPSGPCGDQPVPPHAAYTTGQTIHVNGGGYLN